MMSRSALITFFSQANQGSAFLAAVAVELLAASIVSKLPAHSQVVVHDADPYPVLVSSLISRAAEKELKILFTTSDKTSKTGPSLHLGSWTSKHVVKALIPATTTHFVDLAVSYEGQNVSRTVQECLPAACQRIQMGDISRSEPSNPLATNNNLLAQALEDAVRVAATGELPETSSSSIPAGELSSLSGRRSPTSIVDWAVEDTLTVRVHPITASRLFSREKTYLLVGLTGTLGLSLCKWMLQNGAGTICLTSRKPKVDEKWLAEMNKLGSVKLFAM